MKLKVFEVVELLDGNKATILENNKNRYKAEIVNKYGEMSEIMEKKIYKEVNKNETETTINVLYKEEKICIYTNKVDLQKQLNKLLGEPTKEYKIKRSIVGSSWEIDFKEKSKISQMILKANIYEL